MIIIWLYDGYIMVNHCLNITSDPKNPSDHSAPHRALQLFRHQLQRFVQLIRLVAGASPGRRGKHGENTWKTWAKPEKT